MPTVSSGLYRWIFKRGSTIEDFADRLNHFWTVGILLIFAAIISWKQGVSDPMVCWCPAQFTDTMSRYVHSHCWNSHYIQYMDDLLEAQDLLNETTYRILSGWDYTPVVTFTFPPEPSLLKLYSTTTTLYQWLPLILVIQALLFKLPYILFYCCHGYTGLNFDKISGLTQGVENLNMADRSLLTRQISRYIYNWCKQLCSQLPWRFLTVAWLLTKILFFCNIVTQMYYLDRYLRTTDPPMDNSTSYGDVIMDNLFSNNASAWRHSPVFPRHVMCDFEIRQLVNIHRYTVECDLPMNEFSEVAFFFLWVWFLFVAIVTSISFVVWMVQIAIPIFRQRTSVILRRLEHLTMHSWYFSHQYYRYILSKPLAAHPTYIQKMLSVSEEFAGLKSNETSKFADFIGEDGVMALKMVGSNSSDLIVSDVICHMWKQRMASEIRLVPDTHAQMGPEVITGAPPLYSSMGEVAKQ